MADKYFLDVDGNLANTSNWTSGSLPSGTDNIYFDKVTKPIVSGLNSFSAVNPARVRFGPQCVAPIGTPDDPIRFGNVTTDCQIFSPNSAGMNIRATAWTKVVIKDGPSVANGINVIGDTVTAIYVRRAPFLRFGVGCTLTLAEFTAVGRNAANIYVTIAPGATCTSIKSKCANVDCEAAVATLQHDDGVWNMKGDTYGAISTSLTLNGSGIFKKTGNLACTYANVIIHKGTFQNFASGGLLTVTDSELNEGGHIYVNPIYTTFTNALQQKGGIEQGVNNKSMVFESMGF